MTCCHCDTTDRQFDAKTARQDLRRFRRRGPDAGTRLLLGAIAGAGLSPGTTLLDVGGGIGAIHHHLLEHGVAQATHLDASRAYLSAATEEADRRGHTGRVTFRHGTLEAVGNALDPADVVTLDRVVCCDPDYAALLTTAASRTRRLLALSYPRPTWYVRGAVWCSNRWRRLWQRSFRVYLHPPQAMDTVLDAQGLRPRWSGTTLIWRIVLYERTL